METFGQFMAFVREQFPGNDRANRMNGSILKHLLKRYGQVEVEYMLRGAAKLGWKDLRALWAKGGAGRRWALHAYWSGQKRAPAAQSLREIFREMGQESEYRYE